MHNVGASEPRDVRKRIRNTSPGGMALTQRFLDDVDTTGVWEESFVKQEWDPTNLALQWVSALI